MAITTATQDTSSKEMEVLEFFLGQQAFGVSVLKIEAIEQYDAGKITIIPTLPPGTIGTLLFRNQTIPLIDLAIELGVESCKDEIPLDEDVSAEEDAVSRIVLVINFNGVTVAFITDGVNRIHRIQLKEISPMDTVFDQGESKFTGSFNIEEHEVLIVDMERLVTKIAPGAGCDLKSEEQIRHPKEHLRDKVKIFLVEDSGMTRSLITDVLAKGNYTDVKTFRDGQAAYDAITEVKKKADQQGSDISEFIDLIISDIEMPQMDGLTLCTHIKQTLSLSVPVIMYSTLCNSEEEMTFREKNAHADAFIPKPQIVKLVETADRLTIDTQN